MRRSRFSEDQIIGVLREHEAGVKTAGLCRKHGISDATFYTWKSKYGGLTVADAARLQALAIDVDPGIKGEQVVDLLDARRPQDHSGGQRAGVHLEGTRLLGVRERRHAGLQPAWQIHRQRLRGIV